MTVFFVVVGIKYFVVAPEHLPSFLPGSLRHTGGIPRYKNHHISHPENRNGVIAMILAALAFIGVYWLGARLISE
jgi:uncharacterized membrane protein